MKRSIVSLFTALIISTDASAYTILSSSTFPGNTITVDYNSTECAPMTAAVMADLITRAMDKTWNTVSWIRIEIVVGVESTSTFDDLTALAENHIIMDCDTGFSSRSATAVGLGGGGSNSSGQRVGHVVLSQDSASPSLFTSMGEVFQINVMAHEIGHAVGLGHSKNAKANMAGTANGSNDITDDDVAGITWLYGTRGFEDFFAGCASLGPIPPSDFGPEDGQALTFFALWLIIISLMWAGLRRRRRYLFSKSFASNCKGYSFTSP